MQQHFSILPQDGNGELDKDEFIAFLKVVTWFGQGVIFDDEDACE